MEEQHQQSQISTHTNYSLHPRDEILENLMNYIIFTHKYFAFILHVTPLSLIKILN